MWESDNRKYFNKRTASKDIKVEKLFFKDGDSLTPPVKDIYGTYAIGGSYTSPLNEKDRSGESRDFLTVSGGISSIKPGRTIFLKEKTDLSGTDVKLLTRLHKGPFKMWGCYGYNPKGMNLKAPTPDEYAKWNKKFVNVIMFFSIAADDDRQLTVAECTIPKGATYYLNEEGIYVSDRIRVDSVDDRHIPTVDFDINGHEGRLKEILENIKND